MDEAGRYGPADDGAVLAAARGVARRYFDTGRPVFERAADTKAHLLAYYAGVGHEVFAVMFLDAHHRLIELQPMFRGTLTQTAVYVREIAKEALRLNAGAVVLAHNHPSGSPEPSRADELLTATAKRALAVLDVRVLDHFVVGATSAVSLAERGLL